MSDNIQLELNFQEKSFEEMTLLSMQKQLDAMSESMGKVRRKLFGEMGEMKKLYAALFQENEMLKTKINVLTHEKTEWIYGNGESLFEICEQKQSVS
jgi:Tfp pilus assembly protein PilO